MFNLFPKKKSVKEILNESGLPAAYQKIAEGGSESIAQLNDKIRQLEVANERWQSRFQTFENVEKQVITNEYAKCAEQRDEFKHQLNAANKEIEALKSKLRDYQDKYAKSFSHNDMNNLQNKIDELKNWLKADDREIETLTVEQEVILKANKDLKDQVKKLKDDIINYVVEKNDELSEANETIKTLKNLPTQGFEDYDSNDFIQKDKNGEPQKHPMYPIHWGGWDKVIEDFAKAEVENKDPFVTNQYQDDMLYKDAYDTKEVEFNADELLNRITEYADYSGDTKSFFKNTFPSAPKSFPNEFQEATTAENLEEKFDKGEDVVDYFKLYTCSCNMCKHAREENTEKSWEEAASDLSLRVVRLEEQVEELSLIKKSRKAIRL